MLLDSADGGLLPGLRAPDGARRECDLSDPEQPRDLSLIVWIEEHFQMRKLRDAYPHWEDTASEKD